jgi:hypothetical protein
MQRSAISGVIVKRFSALLLGLPALFCSPDGLGGPDAIAGACLAPFAMGRDLRPRFLLGAPPPRFSLRDAGSCRLVPGLRK